MPYFEGKTEYGSSAELVRLLCLAVDQLGGKLVVNAEDVTGPKPEFWITYTTSDVSDLFMKDRVAIKVRRVRREVGEVVNVSGLPTAARTVEITDGHEVATYRDSRHGVTVEFTDTERRYETLWTSEIFTMRTKGVALVDHNGSMVAHKITDR